MMVWRSPTIALIDRIARSFHGRASSGRKPVCYTRAMGWRGIFRPGMRAYFIPLVSGTMLVVSAFLPWVVVGEVRPSGFPYMTGVWIIGLGAIAAVLALLSLITRKNSPHPLLRLGLI